MKSNIEKIDTPHGPVTLVTLTNGSGARCVLTTVGAGVVVLEAPDSNGVLADVVLGYADPAAYFGDGPAAGKIPGRYANRIARGCFSLDGNEYHLPINNGPNCNHGGPEGFHNRNWSLVEAGATKAVFRYVSADGEAGFPGELTATASYEWTDDFELKLTLRATTDAPTVVNLTNHTYWNLGGHNSGSMLDHELQLNASTYLPTDSTLIPEGVKAPVEGTPMDFRTAKAIGRDMGEDFAALKYGKGYDNCWPIDGADGTIREAAVLRHPASGRTLRVLTDQPAAQVYGGNWLSGCPANKAGRGYDDYDGIAIECQNYPDAPNKPQFPDAVLRPGEVYERHIIFNLKP